jgi:hydroxymethylpyrimidine pyrophosphatase-like HAD family hydrolase
MKRTIKLLALDLDGTVLNDAKQITPTTRQALEAAWCPPPGGPCRD